MSDGKHTVAALPPEIDPNTGKPWKLCAGCDCPMLPKGVKKLPNEYDHAQGCPYGAVGSLVYWRDERYVWRGTVTAIRRKDSGVYPVHLVVLADVRAKRRGGRNWSRAPEMLGASKNWRHVETEEPRGP